MAKQVKANKKHEPKLIAFFNHKGGVSKTTTVFNIGWKLAQKGHKTLIVDTDPQCNLTSLVLGEDTDKVYDENFDANIYNGIAPLVDGSDAKVRLGKPYKTKQDNLYIYLGDLRISTIESQLSVSLKTSEALPMMKNLPASIGHLIRETAKDEKFEYVLLDMSPSIGVLNECLFMASDHFIIPTTPDYFCNEAIKSLARTFPVWNKEIDKFRDSLLKYAFSKNAPTFLGFISQRFKKYADAPARSFQNWIDIIQDTVNSSLVPVLQSEKMFISEATIKKYITTSIPFNIAVISDFNSLVAQSQKYGVPVYALTDVQIEKSGAVLTQMQKTRADFDALFSDFADGLIVLLANV